jgi:putative DNA methylase
VTFTFHHSRVEAWSELDRALRRSQLQVTATHPVVAEMSRATPLRRAREPIQLDLIVVCRPGQLTTGRRRAGVSEAALLTSAQRTIDRFRSIGAKLTRGDVRVILMGELLKSGSELSSESTLGTLDTRVTRAAALLRA